METIYETIIIIFKLNDYLFNQSATDTTEYLDSNPSNETASTENIIHLGVKAGLFITVMQFFLALKKFTELMDSNSLNPKTYLSNINNKQFTPQQSIACCEKIYDCFLERPKEKMVFLKKAFYVHVSFMSPHLKISRKLLETGDLLLKEAEASYAKNPKNNDFILTIYLPLYFHLYFNKQHTLLKEFQQRITRTLSSPDELYFYASLKKESITQFKLTSSYLTFLENHLNREINRIKDKTKETSPQEPPTVHALAESKEIKQIITPISQTSPALALNHSISTTHHSASNEYITQGNSPKRIRKPIPATKSKKSALEKKYAKREQRNGMQIKPATDSTSPEKHVTEKTKPISEKTLQARRATKKTKPVTESTSQAKQTTEKTKPVPESTLQAKQATEKTKQIAESTLQTKQATEKVKPVPESTLQTNQPTKKTKPVPESKLQAKQATKIKRKSIDFTQKTAPARCSAQSTTPTPSPEATEPHTNHSPTSITTKTTKKTPSPQHTAVATQEITDEKSEKKLTRHSDFFSVSTGFSPMFFPISKPSKCNKQWEVPSSLLRKEDLNFQLIKADEERVFSLLCSLPQRIAHTGSFLLDRLHRYIHGDKHPLGFIPHDIDFTSLPLDMQGDPNFVISDIFPLLKHHGFLFKRGVSHAFSTYQAEFQTVTKKISADFTIAVQKIPNLIPLSTCYIYAKKDGTLHMDESTLSTLDDIYHRCYRVIPPSIDANDAKKSPQETLFLMRFLKYYNYLVLQSHYQADTDTTLTIFNPQWLSAYVTKIHRHSEKQFYNELARILSWHIEHFKTLSSTMERSKSIETLRPILLAFATKINPTIAEAIAKEICLSLKTYLLLTPLKDQQTSVEWLNQLCDQIATPTMHHLKSAFPSSITPRTYSSSFDFNQRGSATTASSPAVDSFAEPFQKVALH